MKLRPLISALGMAIALVVTIGLVQQRQIFQKKAAPLITNTTLSYIHQDQLGSTALVTDANGSVVSRKAYYPYGSIKSSEGQSPTERGYTGQVSDADQTGLLYYNARYYDPVIAKFTQADKAADTLNKYAYVGNNPIINTDPSGNMVEPPMHDFEGFSGGELKGRSKGALGKANPVNWNYPGNLSPFGPYNVTQTYAPTVLALDVAAIGAPIALSCAANPVCVVAVIKVLQMLGVVDEALDAIQCSINYNDPSCAFVGNLTPGPGRVDDVADATKYARRLGEAVEIRAKYGLDDLLVWGSDGTLLWDKTFQNIQAAYNKYGFAMVESSPYTKAVAEERGYGVGAVTSYRTRTVHFSKPFADTAVDTFEHELIHIRQLAFPPSPLRKEYEAVMATNYYWAFRNGLPTPNDAYYTYNEIIHNIADKIYNAGKYSGY